MRLPIATLVAYLATAAASESKKNPNGLPFTPKEAAAHACPAKCQANLAAGIKLDRETFSPSPVRDESFYKTAANFSSSKPGDLLKIAPINNLATYDHTINLPPGVTVYAIEYASIGLNKTKVPVTGFIALPFTMSDSAEKSKFPLVSFAHGTSGYLPNCAPTHSPNFYDYYTWTILTLAGFAVVGTDYAGLGNNATRHVYNAPSINANDVLYGALAAQQAFPDLLTTRWGAAGHSEGGGAVYALTESKAIQSRPDFVGSVAISPSVRVYDEIINAVGSGSSHSKGGGPSAGLAYSAFFVWAAQTADPSLNITKSLTETYIKRYHFGNSLGLCLSGIAGLFTDLTLGKIFLKSRLGNVVTFFENYQSEFGAGLGKKAYAPLLIVQSEGDQTVDYKITEKAYKASCKAGNDVRFVLIPYLDHSATVAATSSIWTRWLKERISGTGSPGGDNCTMVEPKAVDKHAAFAPLDF